MRLKITEQNQPENQWLIAVNDNYSKRKCNVCGEFSEEGETLLIKCPNGHLFDRNANSCENQLKEVLENDEYWLIYNKESEVISVPEHLKSYIIPVTVKV